MKIIYYTFENLEINVENKLFVINIDNNEYFGQLLDSLFYDNNKEFSVFVNDEIVDPEDCKVFIDYYSFDVFSKQILLKLMKHIDKTSNIEFRDKINNVSKQINTIVSEILAEYDICFDYEVSNTILDYLKFANVEIRDSYNTKFEKFINIIEIICELHLYKCLYFINIKSYFSIKEINEIVKLCRYYDILVVVIEDKFDNQKLENEVKLSVDKDLFEILE